MSYVILSLEAVFYFTFIMLCSQNDFDHSKHVQFSKCPLITRLNNDVCTEKSTKNIWDQKKKKKGLSCSEFFSPCSENF